MREHIKEGDRVVVNFNNSQFTLCHGIMVYKPTATGDSWVIEADNGDVHYISEGCTVTKEAEVVK